MLILSNRRWTNLLFLFALSLLAACMSPVETSSNHQIKAGELTVAEPWARPAPQAGGNSALYAVILNGLETPIRLLSATTPAARVVETHETSTDNEVMRMVHHPEGFEIGSGKVLALEPGGKHLMLIDLATPLTPGESIEVTLTFDGADPIQIEVPIGE